MAAAFEDITDVNEPGTLRPQKFGTINAEHIRLLAPDDFRGRVVPFYHREGWFRLTPVYEELTADEQKIMQHASRSSRPRIQL